jgi:hypothetical protein
VVDEFAASGLVEHPLVHAAAQQVQLRLADGPLESQKQAVVVVGGVVDAVLVGQQGLEDGAGLQELVPVLAGACQPAHLQPQDDADLVLDDAGQDGLEAGTAHGIGAAASLVLIDDLDAVGAPAELHGPSIQGILSIGGLAIMEDLLGG